MDQQEFSIGRRIRQAEFKLFTELAGLQPLAKQPVLLHRKSMSRRQWKLKSVAVERADSA